MLRGRGPTKMRDEAYSIAFAKLVKVNADVLYESVFEMADCCENPSFKALFRDSHS
ncbi:hypothetical protein QF002_002031 [Paraburkholderia youngii]